MEDWRSKKAWLGTALVAVVAWIVAHILDLFTFEAIGIWRKLLALISLGSAHVRDLPYSTAAMNPYPLPSLILLFLLCVFPTGALVGTIVGRMFLAERRAKLNQLLAINPPDEANAKLRDMQVTLKRKLFLLLTLPTSLIAIYALIPLGIINQAVLIRRIYEADRDIITPYLTQDQKIRLQADFSAIDTKAEFDSLMNRIRSIAIAHGVKLRSEYSD